MEKMFHIYTDEPALTPPNASASGKSPPNAALSMKRAQRAKLTIMGHSSDDITLAPELPLSSYEDLKRAIERVLVTLPAPMVSLSSIQFRDSDGDFIDILESTFDPNDFIQSSNNVYLRARVHPSSGRRRKEGASRATKAPGARRLVLGHRDANVMSASARTDAVTAMKKTGQTKTANGNAERYASSIADSSTGAMDRLVIPSARQKTVLPQAARTAGQATRSSPGALKAVTDFSRSQAVPQFVFGEKSRNSRSKSAADSSAAAFKKYSAGVCSGEENTVVAAEPVRRNRTGAAAAVRKPSWNDRAEPQWEEAERKKTAMRKAARARILSKRAVAAANRNQKVMGGQARVIRRAKRDCRVTDARRRRLGAYLFHDPIGAPPSSLGKRKLSIFREMGREAAFTMKYLQIIGEERATKRARGLGETVVVTARGMCGSLSGENGIVEAAPATTTTAFGAVARVRRHHVMESTTDKMAVTTTAKQKRAVLPNASSTRPSATVKAPPPPTMRPGDIGFRGGSASGGAIMRPPTSSSLLVSSRRAAAAASASRQATAFPGGASSSRKARAAVLTAATVAKLAATADSQSWSGKLRGPCSSSLGLKMMAATEDRNKRETAGHGGTSQCKGSGWGAGGAVGDASDKAAAAAIMAKLAGSGGVKGRKGVVAGSGGGLVKGGDVESLQEQVALLKVASGLSDEELTWRMETSKPEANAYRIASAALERAEATYERLLWRQGQLEIARARYSGRGRGGDNASSDFAAAIARIVTSRGPDDRNMSRLKSSAEAVLTTLKPMFARNNDASATPINGGVKSSLIHVNGAAFPADAAATEIRAAAERVLRLAEAVSATIRTGSEIDRPAVVRELAGESNALSDRAVVVERDLRALARKVEFAVGQVEAWQRRKTTAPEYAAEEAAREEAWSEANRNANLAALKEMRKLLPEAVWDMNAGDIQAAAAVGSGSEVRKGDSAEGKDCNGEGQSGRGGVFYPSDLCVRLRECRPLHWLMSAPEDIAGANFLTGEGAPAFTQLEGMDLTEMRAVWCVLPKEFARDADGKKAEWRARFRAQLEGLARQHDRAVITAGWDPVRNRRATCRMPPLPTHRVRHLSYFYPSPEETHVRAEKLRDQHRRLQARKARLSSLATELTEAKAEVDSACADARSDTLRAQYGADTLRSARDAAKGAYETLVRERKTLLVNVAEGQQTLSATYPSLAQLESEAGSIAAILGQDAPPHESVDNEGTTAQDPAGDHPSSSTTATKTAAGVGTDTVASARSVPGAFSAEPALRRRSGAVARKLSPEEERLLRASELKRAVSARDTEGTGESSACGGGGDQGSSVRSFDTERAQPEQRASECHKAAPLSFSDQLRSGSESFGAVAAKVGRVEFGGRGKSISGNHDQASASRRAVSKVKIAPGVLAFLTREHTSRAGAAAAGATAQRNAFDPDVGLMGCPTATSSEERKKESDQGLSGLRGGTARASIADTASTLGAVPVRGTAAPKPMSKSLSALLARNGGSDDVKDGLKMGVKSPLSFLDELKARGAGDSKSISTEKEVQVELRGEVGESGRSANVVGCEIVAEAVASGYRTSFLDELRANTSKIE